MNVVIAGHYITQFGELWNNSLVDLLEEAIKGSIKDSGFKESEIEAVFVSNMGAGQFDNQLHLGAMASQMIEGYPPSLRIEGACASGGLAMVAAQNALLSQKYKTVLVVGVEKMNDADSSLTTKYLAGAANYSSEKGSTFPGLYAMLANAHMKEFGTSREELSSIAMKNHLHAFDNPNAQYHKNFSIDQISKSTLVADPLCLLDCSPITDGAAAVILTTKNVEKKNKKGLKGINKKRATIIGSGHGQDSLDLANRASLLELAATTRAAKQAYKMANLEAKDIDVAEVHDCFTIAEILATEDLGFIKKGQGGKAALNGETTYKGKIVINPSGGLKASGHPVGATGIKQIAYLSSLLEQGKFKVALAHNVGGSGATAVVHILTI
ncbi:MAG: thiolase domain-containing protein [Candidatus Pacebacteria bacterium]|nr:thiolase domain-containing protein [Candidatus Paceibacterota bacterium]